MAVLYPIKEGSQSSAYNEEAVAQTEMKGQVGTYCVVDGFLIENHRFGPITSNI